ncbi:MAG: class I SAM-dependent methyltransferase [Flavobacteriaceae bacterium]|nr:class I SAM-dependent methyltransferase [Flavobacteriaceae bacterium]
MFFQITSYLNFLIRSSNKHGVHSPFVYDLITRCFNDKSPKDWYKMLESFRNSLLINKTKIEIEDLGAGSKKLHQNKRQISQIAKNAGITKKRANLLGRLAVYIGCKNILEIGTSLGIGTASLAMATPKNSITTLEGCRNTAAVAKENFKKLELHNINMVIGNFDNTLPGVLKNNIYNLIFFDGNHQKEATLKYFSQCLEHSHNDSVFIFDDIYWSKGMQEAWQNIKSHPKVTISIDTFQWGLVFFRNEQEKQHFTIRV